MTFAVGFTWISATLLAFVHISKNAIFLYEFDEEAGRIKFVRALELPPLCDGGSLNFAHCLSGQNPVFHRRTDTATTTTTTTTTIIIIIIITTTTTAMRKRS